MASMIDGSILVVQVKIDGIELLIAFDTGTTTSNVAEKTALKYDFQIIKSDVYRKDKSE